MRLSYNFLATFVFKSKSDQNFNQLAQSQLFVNLQVNLAKNFNTWTGKTFASNFLIYKNEKSPPLFFFNLIGVYRIGEDQVATSREKLQAPCTTF